MRHVSFNIGPSEVSDAVRQDLVELAGSDLLCESHRGPVIQGVLKNAVANLRAAMRIPDEYAVVFQPSATACMEVICRNVVETRSFHFVHGAFSGRMAATAEQVGLAPTVHETPWDETTHPETAQIDDTAELISLAHNETSTGLQWPWHEIRALRDAHPQPMLAIDVTSSFGAMTMDWTLGDFWFFSIQKCLGLPAGLGVLLASPRAIERAREIGAQRRVAGWQDLVGMAERIKVGETQETPNALGIELLSRQMARWDIDAVESRTRAKAGAVADAMPDEAFFIRDPDWRSLTAHCLQVPDPAGVKARALERGFVIGSGYGPLKPTCIRLATFPSVTVAQVVEVLDLIRG